MPTPERLLSDEVFAARRRLSDEFRSAEPFPHVVVDGFLRAEVCRELLELFPPYDDARFRNQRGDRGKAHHEDVRELGPSFSRLDDYLRSDEFLGWVGEVTGISNLIFDPEYFGGGTHENLDDMELDPHVDFTKHPVSGLYRRLNLLLYLNREWDESWGGALELHTDPWSPEIDRTKVVLPLFNRCVLFATSHRSWHGFQTIRCDQKLSRKSFALYLYTRERPDGPFIPSDLTVFVDRPIPPHVVAGHALTEADVSLLQRLLIRRDMKLRHLYDRAIHLANDVENLKSAKDDA